MTFPLQPVMLSFVRFTPGTQKY